MKTAFEQIGYLAVTFADGGCTAGQVCKVSGNGTVSACADGEKFCGIADHVRGGYAAVQVAGFAKAPYTGTAPSVGYVNLCADGNGGVKSGTGREYLVVAVNPTENTVTIKL